MEEINMASLLSVAGTALVVGVIIQIVKGWLVERFIPLASIAVGIALAVVASIVLGHTGAVQLGNAAITGLLGGAAASGIYDFTNQSIRGR